MFIKENYILGNELAQISNFNIANISMFVKKLHEEENFEDVKQLGNCTFINKNYSKLPKYLIKNTNKCTDISNKLPVSFLKKEFSLQKDVIIKALKQYITRECTIAGKEFIEFNSEFVSKFKNKIYYVLGRNEMQEALQDKTIDGFIELQRNKFLVWY